MFCIIELSRFLPSAGETESKCKSLIDGLEQYTACPTLSDTSDRTATGLLSFCLSLTSYIFAFIFSYTENLGSLEYQHGYLLAFSCNNYVVSNYNSNITTNSKPSKRSLRSFCSS